MSAIVDWAFFDDEGLLDALERERNLFSKADESWMRAAVLELERRGVYRLEEGWAHSSCHRAMLSYGARWFRWRGTLRCPHCDADLRDVANGPPFLRSVARVERDRVASWSCPDCGKEWPR